MLPGDPAPEGRAVSRELSWAESGSSILLPSDMGFDLPSLPPSLSPPCASPSLPKGTGFHPYSQQRGRKQSISLKGGVGWGQAQMILIG